MSETEQDKTEDPTPYKLRQAREKGQIARGMDLPFFGSLLGLTLFTILFGHTAIDALTRTMATSLSLSESGPSEENIIHQAIANIYGPYLSMLLTVCACTVSFVLLMQIIQNKGILFTTHPLKPDFSKLNPAKGLKRIFSIKTLKEAGKNILKMGTYLGCTYLVIQHCINLYGSALSDANNLIRALYGSGLRLIYVYVILSFGFALIDQVIVRNDFFKQMKMNRSEVKREVKDQEGEPRIKRKRKELHREFSKTTGSLGELDGSDLVIVNPQHFAVALKYDAMTMTAPIVATKGRNKIAQRLKSRASSLGIPILQDPPLARALFRQSKIGQTIPPQHFRRVADSYAATISKARAQSNVDETVQGND